MTPKQMEYIIKHTPDGFIHRCGTKFEKLGYGKYPYECITKDKFPRAMVYHCPKCACWFHDETDNEGDKP